MCGWTSYTLCHINHPPETSVILSYWSQKYTLTYSSPDFRLKSSFFESLKYHYILRFMIFAWYLAQAFTIFKWFLYICISMSPSLFLVAAGGRVESKRRVVRRCCLMSGGKALSWWGSSVRAISSIVQWSRGNVGLRCSGNHITEAACCLAYSYSVPGRPTAQAAWRSREILSLWQLPCSLLPKLWLNGAEAAKTAQYMFQHILALIC